MMPVQSRRYWMVLAMLQPECLFLRQWNPMSAALNVKHLLDLLVVIQCKVNAKYPAIFEFDQISAVKLICLLDSY